MILKKHDNKYSIYGQEIISLLRFKNKSQKWLAQQCGITTGMISHIVTGYALPSLPVAIKIAKSLDTTVDDIFGSL